MSWKRFILVRLAVLPVVIGLVAVLLGPGLRDKGEAPLAQGASVEAVSGEGLGSGSMDQGATVELTNAQPIGAFSDYWTCVGMVGGQIAYFVITKQWWNIPSWVWPKVRAACWRFIRS